MFLIVLRRLIWTE